MASLLGLLLHGFWASGPYLGTPAAEAAGTHRLHVMTANLRIGQANTARVVEVALAARGRRAGPGGGHPPGAVRARGRRSGAGVPAPRGPAGRRAGGHDGVHALPGLARPAAAHRVRRLRARPGHPGRPRAPDRGAPAAAGRGRRPAGGWTTASSGTRRAPPRSGPWSSATSTRPWTTCRCGRWSAAASRTPRPRPTRAGSRPGRPPARCPGCGVSVPSLVPIDHVLRQLRAARPEHRVGHRRGHRPPRARRGRRAVPREEALAWRPDAGGRRLLRRVRRLGPAHTGELRDLMAGLPGALVGGRRLRRSRRSRASARFHEDIDLVVFAERRARAARAARRHVPPVEQRRRDLPDHRRRAPRAAAPAQPDLDARGRPLAVARRLHPQPRRATAAGSPSATTSSWPTSRR